MLPKNERTEKILAESEKIEQERKQQEEEVRIKEPINQNLIVKIDAWQRRERTEEERTVAITGKRKEGKNAERLRVKEKGSWSILIESRRKVKNNE